MNRVINHLSGAFISCLIFSCSQSEQKTAEIPSEKTKKTLDTLKSKPAELIELSAYEQLSCSKLEIVPLRKTNSTYSHFGCKAPVNTEGIDSVSVGRESSVFDHENKIQLVLYGCGTLSDGNYDLAVNDEFVNDSIRSFIRIDAQKFYIDQLFERVEGGDYLGFNQFSDADDFYFIRMNQDKFTLIYFTCYYFGNQSWFDYLPIAFEFRKDKLYHTYVLPEFTIDNDPYQFTDFDKDGNLDWICLGEKGVIYSLKDKKINKMPDYYIQLEEIGWDYKIKDTTYNWPCILRQ